MKRVCEENDILMIADEVMTGFGRTGKMFAMEHWGVVPDIMVLGKGMSAGYSPILCGCLSGSCDCTDSQWFGLCDGRPHL